MKKQPTNFYIFESKCKFRKEILGEQRDDEGVLCMLGDEDLNLAVNSAGSLEALSLHLNFFFFFRFFAFISHYRQVVQERK